MEQPKGYEIGNIHKNKCLLQKTLYGLKQSPREWNEVIHKFLVSENFKQSQADSCIYVKRKNENVIFVGVYVDDIISIGQGKFLNQFRTKMQQNFQMTEGGILEWYLGVGFHQLPDKSIILDQSQYIKQKLEEFQDYIGKGGVSTPLPLDYQKCLEIAENEKYEENEFPYRKIIGSLMYAMLGTRPDLATAVSVVSKYLEKPKPSHIKLVQHILKYLKVNTNFQLHYQSHGQIRIICFADAAYANDENYKSRSGYCCSLGGSLISWYSGSQSIVAQSSAEAEYYAAVSASNECIWLKQLLKISSRNY